MEYRVAKNIRGRSLSSLITERITEGSSVGSAIGRSVTQKLKATGTGIIEKFDPLNLVKFATGGSRLAPAVLGKITGRSQKSIEYFAGDRQPTERRSYTPLSRALPKSDFGGSSLNVLNEILNFLRESNSKDIQRRETEKSFIEEKQIEQQRRHKEFIEVLKTYTSLPAYAPVVGKPEEKKDPTGGILDTVKKMIASAVEGIKNVLTGMLSMIGKMIQSAIDKALAVFDWVKNLKWLKDILNLKNILTFLATSWKKAFPILSFLFRFATPAALAVGIIFAGRKLLDLIAESMPNLKALSPDEAAAILQGKSAVDIEKEGGYDYLMDIVKNQKQRAIDALSKYEEDPENADNQRAIRQLGGLSKVQQIAQSTDVDISSLPSMTDIYRGDLGKAQSVRSLEDFVKNARGLANNREVRERAWFDRYGHSYDPTTGLRKDLLENQGPFSNVYGVEGVNYDASPPIQYEQVDPNINVGTPPPNSLSTPINESDLIQTPYQFTPLPVNSQVNALSKVLDEMQLDRSGPSNAPIVSTNTRNIPLPRKPISSSATTRDDTFIFQRTIERNRARY